jgi:predicted transcriptional regulator
MKDHHIANDKKQMLYVKDVFDPSRMNSIVIDENETLPNTIKKFAKQSSLRGIFIIDNKGKLKGVMTRTDLLNIVKAKMDKDIGKIPLRILFIRGMQNIKTKDVVGFFSQKAAIRVDDPLEKALELMINNDLIDIPVVDSNENIIGDLKLSEILSKLISS